MNHRWVKSWGAGSEWERVWRDLRECWWWSYIFIWVMVTLKVCALIGLCISIQSLFQRMHRLPIVVLTKPQNFMIWWIRRFGRVIEVARNVSGRINPGHTVTFLQWNVKDLRIYSVDHRVSCDWVRQYDQINALRKILIAIYERNWKLERRQRESR